MRFACLSATCALATGSLIIMSVQAQSLRLQQQYIEDAGRKQIGLWLRDHAAPNDTVFLEPIGYIGYFSQLKILDYPGLCAPEVSNLIRSGRRDYASIIDALHPTWVVLRPSEIMEQRMDAATTLKDYAIASTWDQRANLDAIKFVPGRSWFQFDAQFVVLRRRESAR